MNSQSNNDKKHFGHVVIYGNCQADALFSILSSSPQFMERCESLNVVIAMFLIKEGGFTPLAISQFSNADTIISIQISDSYACGGIGVSSVRKLMTKNGAKLIKIPNLYFRGYNPELVYLHDEKGKRLEAYKFNYHDVRFIYNRLRDKGCIKSINDDKVVNPHPFILSSEWHIANSNNSISELNSRESNFECDVKMSDFIEKFYKSKYLFHTIDHPTNETLVELAKRIAKVLNNDTSNGDDTIEIVTPSVELLGNDKYPISNPNFLNSKNEDKYRVYLHGYFTKDTYTTKINRLYDRCIDELKYESQLIHALKKWVENAKEISLANMRC